MNIVRRSLFAVTAACLLPGALLATGCGDVYLKRMPPGATDNPVAVQADYDMLFQAVVRTLRDHRFVIFRQDPRLGRIVTKSLTGQQMWEFWRSDAVGLDNQMEGSMHTVLRSIEARIYPVRDEKDQPLAGQYYLDVRAHTERVSVPDRELTFANQLPSSYRTGAGLVDALALEREGTPEDYPVYLGRDGRLEDWLIRDILNKVHHRRPPRPTPPPAAARASS